MSSPTRWAGVPLDDRRAERRELLVEAGFELFGAEGEAAVTIRSVCRRCELNTRYFYESFADVNDFIGAIYDHAVLLLGEAVAAAIAAAGVSQSAQTRAGMRAVLGFSSADPRYGRVLFTDAPANSVLADRRAATQHALFQAVIEEDGRMHPDVDELSAKVGAALFTGAMTELVQQWLTGRLGADLELVLDYALKRVLPG